MTQIPLYPDSGLTPALELSLGSQHLLDAPHLQFIESITRALEARDAYTAGHSDRVSANSVAIARSFNLSSENIESIFIGAKLHDIGKIGVPDAILRKKARLTNEEFSVIRLHPEIGKKILESVDRFSNYLRIVELHHENFDGSGYPHGLKGNGIPIEARIVRVTDVYDALISSRAYRGAMSKEQAIELLRMGVGMQFDPEVVDVFLTILERQRQLETIFEKATSLHSEESPEAGKNGALRLHPRLADRFVCPA